MKFFSDYTRFIIFLLLFCCSYRKQQQKQQNYGKIKRTNKAQTEKDRFGEYHIIPRHLSEREKVL